MIVINTRAIFLTRSQRTKREFEKNKEIKTSFMTSYVFLYNSFTGQIIGPLSESQTFNYKDHWPSVIFL